MAGNEDALIGEVSIFRPSYSSTWLYCEDALLAGLRGGEDHAGVEAAIGTVFHDLMAEWQQRGRPDYRLHTVDVVKGQNANEKEWQVEIDEDMFSYGEQCLDYVASISGETAERLVEQRVDISDLTPIPGQGGTGDVILLDWFVLKIVDWKYGKGVQVFAKWNSQLLLYAWGAFQKYDWIYGFKTIEIHIAQPRLNHWDVFSISRDELIEWAGWAKDRAYAAWTDNTDRTRTPGPKQCQWCKVRSDCVAIEKLREDLADASFDVEDDPAEVDYAEVQEAEERALHPYADSGDPSYTSTDLAVLDPDTRRMPNPMQLTTAQLSQILRYRKLMDGFFRGIADELLTRLSGDETDPNWKVVEGRTRRAWYDEEAVAVALVEAGAEEEKVWTRQLVSPNQSERLLREIGIRGRAIEEWLRPYINKPKGRPTLAPDGDNRIAIPAIIDPFEDVDLDGDEL